MPSTPSLSCPACQGPPRDAVTAACGHTFCWLCLPRPVQMGAQPSGKALLCPLCQEEPQTETPRAPVPLGPLGETYCEEHGEKIYYFCEKDAELLCVFCREGPAHQAHTVGILDEAIQPYRDRLKSRLEALSLERDKIEDVKCQEDQKLQVLLTQIESKKQQVETAFERLQQELGDQRGLLLARLRELEQQIWKERDEYLTKVSKEVARLGVQVTELEEKCQQPASELLQDVRVNQSRCEVRPFASPEAISSDLAKKIRDLHRKILPLPEMMRTFSENLAHHLETDSGVVTLDPRTASGSLVLSEDRRSVRLGAGGCTVEAARRKGPGAGRRRGRLGRGHVAAAVLGQHLPGHRPAAARGAAPWTWRWTTRRGAPPCWTPTPRSPSSPSPPPSPAESPRSLPSGKKVPA